MCIRRSGYPAKRAGSKTWDRELLCEKYCKRCCDRCCNCTVVIPVIAWAWKWRAVPRAKTTPSKRTEYDGLGWVGRVHSPRSACGHPGLPRGLRDAVPTPPPGQGLETWRRRGGVDGAQARARAAAGLRAACCPPRGQPWTPMASPVPCVCAMTRVPPRPADGARPWLAWAARLVTGAARLGKGAVGAARVFAARVFAARVSAARAAAAAAAARASAAAAAAARASAAARARAAAEAPQLPPPLIPAGSA
jgi:hypothetical protein